MNRFVLLAATALCALVAPRLSADDSNPLADPRHVQSGWVIPDEGYCDQPYVVVGKDGSWLCVMTTGQRQEGQRGQHVVSTISKDQGRTWSKPLDIEPADGPEASWATPLLTPSGRVYVFYDYNGDDIRTLGGKPARADMLGWYCFRYSDDFGQSWSKDRYRIPVRTTACDRGNDWQGRVQIFWGISKPIFAEQAALLTFTKLGKHLLDQGEGWLLRSDNIATERDPDRLHWELLPHGEHGLRHPDFGSIQEEHNIVRLSTGELYCIYRTTMGFPCQTYSCDGGATWSEPQPATYTPDGKIIRHPRACPKLWRTAAGKYLLWQHNHAGLTFNGRNPAWICGGVEKEGKLYWSAPEVLLYDDNPDVRMSYPDLIEQDGRYFVTETQKTVARVHALDAALLEGMWRAAAAIADPQSSLEALRPKPAVLSLSSQQIAAGQALVQALPPLEPGKGLSLELRVRLDDLTAENVLLESTGPAGQRMRLAAQSNGSMRIELDDGAAKVSWASDEATLKPKQTAHIIITLDAGPKIITFVVDGVPNDGDGRRDYGWGRFDAKLSNVLSEATLKFPKLPGELSELRIHARPLRNFEALAQFRAAKAP